MKTNLLFVFLAISSLRFPASSQPALPREGEEYSIIAKHSSKSIVLPNATDNYYGMFQSSNYTTVRFVFQRSGDRDYYFILRSDAKSKALAVASGNNMDGSYIVQSDFAGTDNQKFLLTPVDERHFQIATYYGKVIDVYGGPAATADNTPVVQSTWNGGDNQRFKLEEVSGIEPSIRRAPPPEKKKSIWDKIFK